MKLTKKKQFLLAIAIPILVLLSMTVKPLLTTFYGETVYLQTVPYDPRDLFYGDYVDLDFEAETVETKLLDKELLKEIRNKKYYNFDNKKVFLILKSGNDGHSDVHQVTRVTHIRPTSGIYIEGALSYMDEDTKIHINLPIERYYIPEGTGKQLEDDARKGRLIAKIKVFRGYPILESVKKEGS